MEIRYALRHKETGKLWEGDASSSYRKKTAGGRFWMTRGKAEKKQRQKWHDMSNYEVVCFKLVEIE